MENNAKELLLKFEKASEQLEEVTDVIKSFTEGMNEFFKATDSIKESFKNVEYGINIEKIKEMSEDVEKNLEEIQSIIVALPKDTKKQIQEVKDNQEIIIKTEEKSTKETNNLIERIVALSSDIAEVKDNQEIIIKTEEKSTKETNNLRERIVALSSDIAEVKDEIRPLTDNVNTLMELFEQVNSKSLQEE